MSSRSATDINHGGTCIGLQEIKKPVNELTGFFIIPVTIQAVVMRRIKPLFKPGQVLYTDFFRKVFPARIFNCCFHKIPEVRKVLLLIDFQRRHC